MKQADYLRRLRLHHQWLDRPVARRPEEIVAHFGAVQSQDFGMAKWALALRGAELTEARIADAFDAGAILRTHALRNTWHFVAPADIRWLVRLAAPRGRLQASHTDRTNGVDASMVRRARAVIERVLPGAHLTRDELQAEFARRGLVLAGPALAQVMMYAELDALVCSGPRRGKQSTYALLEERVPAAPVLDREAALAELTRRYFQSHGPATARDFSWWSGLTLADVRTGIASLGRSLTRVDWEGTAYYYVAGDEPGRGRGAWLLPNYDEFTVAYADRSLLIGPDFPTQLNPRANPIFNNVILVHGVIAGTWRRTLTKKDVKIALSPFRPLPATTRRAVLRASHRFRAFAL